MQLPYFFRHPGLPGWLYNRHYNPVVAGLVSIPGQPVRVPEDKVARPDHPLPGCADVGPGILTGHAGALYLHLGTQLHSLVFNITAYVIFRHPGPGIDSGLPVNDVANCGNYPEAFKSLRQSLFPGP